MHEIGEAELTRIEPQESDLLLVVDIQNDFLPGGALGVPEGERVIAPCNAVARHFAHVALTQDWHPRDHISFAANHPGRQAFETIALPYGEQILWPVHCVQGSFGAALHDGLAIPHAELVIRKGYHRAIDSYSAFAEADGKTRTGLASYLRERGFTRLFLVGLATDFCVAYSAVDAAAAGFAVFVLEDCCRAIDTPGSLAAAWDRMKAAGVIRIASSDIG